MDKKKLALIIGGGGEQGNTGSSGSIDDADASVSGSQIPGWGN